MTVDDQQVTNHEQTFRGAEPHPPGPSISCCDDDTQDHCCAPSSKPTCCGTDRGSEPGSTSGCGCQ
jgi:hypothetical protein